MKFGTYYHKIDFSISILDYQKNLRLVLFLTGLVWNFSEHFHDIMSIITIFFTGIDIFIKINIYRNFYINFVDILWKRYVTLVFISVLPKYRNVHGRISRNVNFHSLVPCRAYASLFRQCFNYIVHLMSSTTFSGSSFVRSLIIEFLSKMLGIFLLFLVYLMVCNNGDFYPDFMFQSTIYIFLLSVFCWLLVPQVSQF